jgi:hypothetical protein
VNIVAVHKDRAHFLKSAEVPSNTADQYYDLLTQMNKELQDQKIRVCAVVGDNASAVQNALKRYLPLNVPATFHFPFCYRIERDDPSIVPVRCAAHTMQLLLHDLEVTPLIKGALVTMEKLLESLSGKESQDKLKEVQKAAGRPEGSVPVKPVDTRYQCIFRYCFCPNVLYADGPQRCIAWSNWFNYVISSDLCFQVSLNCPCTL